MGAGMIATVRNKGDKNVGECGKKGRGAVKKKDGKKMDGLAVMRRVLSAEAEGLRMVADSLDAKAQQTLDALSGLKGRVIFTGMGKSGHIARKIAASFSSTGTPSYFIHPAEASHGDLGMISHDDVVVALSKSGNTAELRDIVAYTRRFGILLVAICGRGDTHLARACDIALLLPDVGEACRLGLAPTTSTTMMLGLGDALALALFEMAGASSQSFGRYHPGGQLGRGFIRVSDVMAQGDDIPLCAPGFAMDKALLIMTGKRFGCVGIVDTDGRLMGIITDGDLRRHISDGFFHLTAAEVMTRDPHTIAPDALVAAAVGKMNDAQITNLFVADDKNVVRGILHIHDCLRVGVV